MNKKIYTEALEEFQKFSKEEKKQKLLETIKEFGDVHPIFQEIENDINTIEYSDNILVRIYKIILESIEKIETE